MKFKSFKFSEPWVFPGHRTQTGVDVLGSAGGVVFQLPANDVLGGSVAVPADHILPVCAEILGVDAHYLALCVAQMKGNTVFKGSPTFERLVPALRLLSVGVVTSVVCTADGNTETVESGTICFKQITR